MFPVRVFTSALTPSTRRPALTTSASYKYVVSFLFCTGRCPRGNARHDSFCQNPSTLSTPILVLLSRKDLESHYFEHGQESTGVKAQRHHDVTRFPPAIKTNLLKVDSGLQCSCAAKYRPKMKNLDFLK